MDCHFKAQVFNFSSQFGCFRLLGSGPHEMEERLRPFALCVMQIALKLSTRDGLSVPGKPIANTDIYDLEGLAMDDFITTIRRE
jgi:hypothetical protein